MQILIIEDSPVIVETISLALEIRWPDVNISVTSTGEQGIEMTETESPDVIILDLGLPDISGFDVLKRIRLFSNIPIIILTARQDETDIVKGLEWGADDYMTKPFKQLELLARVQGAIRRYRHLNEKVLVCGPLRLDPISLKLTLNGNEIRITRTEGLIMGHLMKNAGNVVTYSSLGEAMWGGDFPEASDSIKVHIRHLREKLETNPGKPKLIIIKPGMGYLLTKES
jgi:two-component system KDP operon response regulator KdpE